jgi:microsomal dipeptidase-like Zn-dependent dipeptidase
MSDGHTHTFSEHQQTYYTWVERAWRGGQRIMVNDLGMNAGLCLINSVVAPPHKFDCDDMNAVRGQAAAARSLESFIDHQVGGPGQGWYRIVTTPAQARDVVAAEKLAVVLGVEVSEPFGCKQNLGISGCDRAAIDRGLDELKTLGVSSMFLCHKFDNALCGVRYDAESNGIAVNLGQFLTTGTWWNPQPCKVGEVPHTAG